MAAEKTAAAQASAEEQMCAAPTPLRAAPAASPPRGPDVSGAAPWGIQEGALCCAPEGPSCGPQG
eukprot:2936089-Pyramimonas_sp.AAC.1